MVLLAALALSSSAPAAAAAAGAGAAAASAPEPESLCKCKTTGPTPIGNCSISVEGCGCIEHFKLKYKAQATEEHSGVSSGYQEWFDSSDGAGTHAVFALVNDHLVHTTPTSADPCNCFHQDQKLSNCTIRATVCAMFNTTDDVSSGKVSYHAWATDLTSLNVGEVTQYADPVNAAKAAFTALFTKYPQEAKACGLPAAVDTVLASASDKLGVAVAGFT